MLCLRTVLRTSVYEFACEKTYTVLRDKTYNRPGTSAGPAASRARIRLVDQARRSLAEEIRLHGSLSGCAPLNTVYRSKWRVATETRNEFHRVTGEL